MLQQEDFCKCCGNPTQEVWTITNKYIYNDFDLTGQEVDPIWCGDEHELVGFKELCLACEIKQAPTEDDLPF